MAVLASTIISSVVSFRIIISDIAWYINVSRTPTLMLARNYFVLTMIVLTITVVVVKDISSTTSPRSFFSNTSFFTDSDLTDSEVTVFVHADVLDAVFRLSSNIHLHP